jgi:hypothetical protein
MKTPVIWIAGGLDKEMITRRSWTWWKKGEDIDLS